MKLIKIMAIFYNSYKSVVNLQQTTEIIDLTLLFMSFSYPVMLLLAVHMNNNNKELTMDKLKLIGVTALAGSLAATSAIAGSMSVSGSATVTHTTKTKAVTGQSLGMASGLTFTGSGELDNGNAVSVNIAHDDQNTWSAGDVSLTVDGLGTFKFDQGGGTGIDRIDDKMPTAWEESDGAGSGAGLKTVSGVGGGTDIEWAVSSDMLPGALKGLYISFSPEADGQKVNDKSTGGNQNNVGSGFDIVADIGMGGADVFVGYTDIEREDGPDQTVKGVGFTYAVGGITVGYQITRDELGGNNGNVDAYENDAFGISFSINDDLSVSYGEHESTKEYAEGSGVSDVSVTTGSLQAAYSMGGMSLKVAMTDVSNGNYSTAAGKDYDVTSMALTLAF